MSKFVVILLASVLLGSASLTAQKKVRLISTDDWMYDKAQIDAQRLIGNVHLEYEGTHFYADSVYLFPNDNFDGFGNVRMTKANEYNLTGTTIHFEENTHTAEVKKDVTLQDGEMTLKTNYLTYNTRTAIANYQGGGKITSAKDQNQLKSERGSYHSRDHVFYFRTDVELKNPDYKVHSDTLQYYELSEIAYFFGPTHIIGDSTRLYCENGYYNTKLDQSRFGQNAKVTSGKVKLQGDSIFYDGLKGIGEVFRKVTITDTTSGVQIHGQYGKHRELDAFSFVTQEAWMSQQLQAEDTLFVTADSLFLLGNNDTHHTLRAYHSVSFFQNELQGVCDSLVFFEKDSLLELHHQPIMWNDNNQLTCDTVQLYIKNGSPDKLYMRNNAFIVSQALANSLVLSDSSMLHQIKGRNMTGQFVENELRSLYVEGNAQLIYFAENEDHKSPHIIGHNKGDCSNILISLSQRKIQKIRLEQEPRSVYSPLQKVVDADLFLNGAKWDDLKRPSSALSIRTFKP